jgi:hypothetical protein
MNRGSRKPISRRAPPPNRQGGRFVDLPDAPGPPRSSKKGLWITIGIHAALFAAAYFIALPMPAGTPAKTASPAAIYDDFQMPVRMAVPQGLSGNPAILTEAKSIPFQPAQKAIFAIADLPSELEWPAFAPMFAPRTLVEKPAEKIIKPKTKKARRIKR